MKKNIIEIQLGQNLKSVIPEIVFKVLLGIVAIIILKPDDLINFNIGIYDISTGVFIPFLIIILNISLTLLTIFSTGRRRKSIYDFYKTKIISHPEYGLSSLSFKSDFQNSPFKFMILIGASVFTCINFLCLYKGNENFSGIFQSIMNVSVIVVSCAGYFLLMWIYRENWVSMSILNISVNKKKLNKQDKNKVIEYLNHYEEDSDIHYINDSLIHEFENNSSVFKQRLDTLLLEAVFLGALAFGTFVQITSPESIDELNKASDSKGFFKDWVEDRWDYITQDFTNFHLDEVNESDSKNIKKGEWTEHEYFFIIAIGSLICSVLYISVLLKRFPIIKAIENLNAEIKSAKTWNRREEDVLLQEMKSDIEEAPDIVKEKLVSKRKYYTERLQEKLAYCQLLKNRIETNLIIISTIRTIGLYSFFFVLLTSTSMISPNLTLIFVFILAYSLIGSVFMQKEGRAKKVWERLTGNEKIK